MSRNPWTYYLLLGWGIVSFIWWHVGDPQGVHWQAWSSATFDQAAEEDRPLLVSVHSNRCHWCHLMDERTYRDREVVAKLREGFVPVKLDPTASLAPQPQFTIKGQPTTVVLSADGTILAQRTGYLNAGELIQLLSTAAAAANPRAREQAIAANRGSDVEADGATRRAMRVVRS